MKDYNFIKLFLKIIVTVLFIVSTVKTLYIGINYSETLIYSCVLALLLFLVFLPFRNVIHNNKSLGLQPNKFLGKIAIDLTNKLIISSLLFILIVLHINSFFQSDVQRLLCESGWLRLLTFSCFKSKPVGPDDYIIILFLYLLVIVIWFFPIKKKSNNL